MHYFTYINNQLYCEEVPIYALAQEYGTPLYVYSQRTILEHFRKLKAAFSSVNPLICYSVKANSNLALLKLLVSAGAGLDIVSGGELYRARCVGCPGKKIVYASVGKTQQEIQEALRYGIGLFNVESEAELRNIAAVAGKKYKVNVALRLNPNVTPKTHSYITTGKKETKFGIDPQGVKKILMNEQDYPHINFVGIHIHIGSQIIQAHPFLAAIKKTLLLIEELRVQGIRLHYLNIGGGLGIVYGQEKPQTVHSFAEKILPLLKKSKMKIILEPGRFIVGNAGVLLTRVLYLKHGTAKRFVIVDAAMNDLLRPSLYNAYHKIIPVNKQKRSSARAGKQVVDIVGPVCESGDFLGKARKLFVEQGEYLAVLGAGAYAMSMSSNYNSRCRPAEVLVAKKKVSLIRRREKYKDLVRQEKMS